MEKKAVYWPMKRYDASSCFSDRMIFLIWLRDPSAAMRMSYGSTAHVDSVAVLIVVGESAGCKEVICSPNRYSTFSNPLVASINNPHSSPLKISYSAVIPPPSLPFLNSATTPPSLSTNLVPSSVVCLFRISSSSPIFRMMLMADPRMSID